MTGPLFTPWRALGYWIAWEVATVDASERVRWRGWHNRGSPRSCPRSSTPLPAYGGIDRQGSTEKECADIGGDIINKEGEGKGVGRLAPWHVAGVFWGGGVLEGCRAPYTGR